MAGRKKRRPDSAKPVQVLLTGQERVVLALIEARRQERSEEGDSPSEIVADALWYFLEQVEKVPADQIKTLVPGKSNDLDQPKVKQFPKK